MRSAERALEARYEVYLEEAQRLIRAGSEEIREQGNVAPRVADVVRRAQLSNKAFYRHFKSKEELLLAVLEEGMQQRVAEFEKRMAAASTARGRVEAWIEGVLVQATDPEEARAARPMYVYQARLADNLGDQLWETRERLFRPLVEALRAGFESGELPDIDPERDADAIQYLCLGWVNGHVLANTIPSAGEARAIAEFAMRGLDRG
ncbi:MAG: TetR/AcrR family transcriptional regulator [Myxococcota bacterium]|nr:TetR family transcriptional regulator [bacterium]MDP6242509.1 TetR/AcrR family transcriptional regulator [Myxococcota bacterium]MDP7073699.1 TetR/AcrR family transcriptional regulator [Myxococcota bacterium]MDP7298660.1 TetR/AcrR family transcriptional regulator [Myxococcota bacterium]MDP7432595.1 TetR/AcrR family transcriptional regulator [Myxococcota bacterium]